MPKKKSQPKMVEIIPPKVDQPSEFERISNDLSSALGLTRGNPFGVQLSQVDTVFKNLRWYLVSNYRQMLSQSYVEIGLIQTIVDLPVDDALRGGVKISTQQLDEDQINQLENKMEREDDLGKMGQGLKWNRLFGGGGIVIITDQDPTTPLDLDSIKEDTPFEFRSVDMWELFWSKQNTSDYAASIDTSDMTDVEFYDYYGQQLHKSRVLKLVGMWAPSFVRPRLRGWGFSCVETLVRSINQYLKSNNLSFEVLDEFKLDIFKIKNLTSSLLSRDGQERIHKRVQIANLQKNYQNALTMDSEDDYLQKQLSFTGIAETMVGIRMQIASDMRMPMSKLFGTGSQGFSSGQDDIENYNAMVESQVRQKSKFYILKMIEMRCQQMFGFIPDDLSIEFKPLRVLSSEQEENVKTAKFNRILAAKTAGEISSKEFKEACNSDDLLPIQLDTSQEALDAQEAGNAEQGNEATKAVKKAGPKSTKEAPTAKNSFLNSDELLAKGLISNPGNVDEAKWEAAKKACMKEYGKMKWAVVMHIYEQEGGETKKSNSLEFDVAGFHADGGDSIYAYPPIGEVDKTLWLQAEQASLKAFGKDRWQFVHWYYKKHGGKYGV